MIEAMKQICLLLSLIFLLPLTVVWAPAATEAEIIIFNGKIITVDSPDPNNFTTAQAAAIFGGRFIAVGSNESIQQYLGAKTQKMDLGGRTVLPGLVETHDHIHNYSSHFRRENREAKNDPPLSWTSKDEGLAQLRTLALQKKPGEWINTTIRGGGARATSPPLFALAVKKGEITRFDLDKVTPNNPVRIYSIFFSPTGDSFVNTKALEPLLDRYPNLAGVHKDAKGIPTGWLTGVADQTIEYEFGQPVPPQDLAPSYKQEMEEVAAEGLTTVSTRLDPDSVGAYSWLHARGEMPIRMAYSMETAARSFSPDAIVSRMTGFQGGSGKHMWGMGDDKLWTIGLSSISIDSVPPIGGSCVSKPYPREAPNFPLWRYQLYGPNGLCRLNDPNYRDADLLRAAAKYGFRISGLHTGGDLGVDEFLNIVEQVVKEYPDVAERRWSMDHCRYMNDQEAVRAKSLGLYFSCGPKYVYEGDKGDIGAYKLIYGEQDASDVVVPLRRLLDHGLRVVMELDQHGFFPFTALQVAVNRKDMNGKVWGPQQRISRQEALYMYTRWSSEYVLKENLLGSIEPNKLADFVVLDKDYLTVPEEEIGRLNPVLTVVGGKIVFTQPEFASAMNLPQIGYRGAETWWWRGTPEDAKSRQPTASATFTQ